MDHDENKVDEVVLALLFLNSFDDGGVTRAWKSIPWDSMDRLYEKGYIGDPKSKSKSVIMTEEGEAAAEAMFTKLFVK
jgi:hypothetical protein